MYRLWQNKNNAYCGEKLQVRDTLLRAEELARTHGFDIERIEYGKSVHVLALKRARNLSGRNIYLSAGIHGDEPAGVLALLSLIEKNAWPADANLWVVPCLNPEGFECNRRENEHCIDLNRDYFTKKTPEVRAHVAWLEQQPDFDLSVCLHEDWEASGFYLYELKEEGKASLAKTIIEKVGAVFPIETADVIDSFFPAKNGIIDATTLPLRIRDGWPEAIWLFKHKSGLNYTLETSSDFDLGVRANALALGIEAALRGLFDLPR